VVRALWDSGIGQRSKAEALWGSSVLEAVEHYRIVGTQ